MNFNQIDLNLLRILRVVYATRSVSKAAVQLDMTQSAVSNALRRLRNSLNDALFVRGVHGMLPTALVDSMISQIESGLDNIEAAVQTKRQFSPQTSDQLFRIWGNDLGQMVLLPNLIKHFSQAAPNVRVETVDVSVDEGTRLMREGLIDLAIGNWPALGADYFRQRLFSDSLVILMSKDHDLFARKISKSDYMKARHVDYRPGGATYTELRGVLEKALANEDTVRHVTFTAGHALGLSSIIAESNLLLTLPGRLASSFASGRTNLGIKPLPFDSPTLTITQQWHARVHFDPATVWFRNQIAELFSSAPHPSVH